MPFAVKEWRAMLLAALAFSWRETLMGYLQGAARNAKCSRHCGLWDADANGVLFDATIR